LGSNRAELVDRRVPFGERDMIRSAVLVPALCCVLGLAGCDARPPSYVVVDITRLVFPGVFASLAYDAATCTTTSTDDAGTP
jgi:hypothetical protein